jgi:hypothetical protein
VGAGAGISDGFARLSELLHAPDLIKGAGTLAMHDGKISRIERAPQGGWNVTVTPTNPSEHEPVHYISTARTMKAKEGQSVKAGDELSDGSFRPQDIAATRGLKAAQEYVVAEVGKAFASTGSTMRRGPIETVVAGMMRWMRITNDGGEADLAIGDILSEQVFDARRKKNAKIQGVPEIPGMRQVPIVRSRDLMERLNFQRLEDAFRDVPASAGKSDLTGGASPLPGLAYGAAFRGTEHGLVDLGAVTKMDTGFNRSLF